MKKCEYDPDTCEIYMEFNEDLFKEQGETIKSQAETIERLKKLADGFFINPMIQTYAGSNFECMFCGCVRGRSGAEDHSSEYCPVTKYQDLLKELEEG